jgi:hypothetical protein
MDLAYSSWNILKSQVCTRKGDRKSSQGTQGKQEVEKWG